MFKKTHYLKLGKIFIFSSACLISSLLWAQKQPLPALQVVSPLKRLALAITQQSLLKQQDFIAIAITQLAHSYDEEIASAVAEKKHHSAWINQVRAYTNKLRQQSASAIGTTQLKIQFTQANELALTVNRQTAIISAARSSQQLALEKNIIAEFCNKNACEKMISSIQRSNPGKIEKIHHDALLSWSFDDNGKIACDSGQGLFLQFPSMKDLPAKRRLCKRFMHELALILINLQQLHRQENLLNWQQFDLQPVSGESHHQLTINNHGDVLWLSLPLSFALPDLLRQAMPWLQAQFSDKQLTLHINVEELTPQLHVIISAT
ncbi:MAG: hypothetical protein HRU20_19635 [Pseudomonadales bacterium]|nr:hypothetical protein [Pseudomonadales bacterium]